MPLNLRRKAVVFSGDIGALSAGFLFAAGVLLLTYESDVSVSIYLGAMMVLPFLADVLLTLLWRVKSRQNLLKPHRDHLYQRAIRNGVSHIKISLIYYGAFALCAGVALGVSMQDQIVISTTFLAMIIISIVIYILGCKLWQVETV